MKQLVSLFFSRIQQLFGVYFCFVLLLWFLFTFAFLSLCSMSLFFFARFVRSDLFLVQFSFTHAHSLIWSACYFRYSVWMMLSKVSCLQSFFCSLSLSCQLFDLRNLVPVSKLKEKSNQFIFFFYHKNSNKNYTKCACFSMYQLCLSSYRITFRYFFSVGTWIRNSK